MSTAHEPDGTSPPSPATDRMPEVTRSEEELVITRQVVETGRVRLVKRIVTETVTRTVEVRREELHVERSDATDAERAAVDPEAPPPRQPPPHSEGLPARLRGGIGALQRRSRYSAGAAAAEGPFADEDMEIVLMQEEVVITKRVVPRERVRLRRETVVEQRTIQESLRKEQVELIEEPIDREAG